MTAAGTSMSNMLTIITRLRILNERFILSCLFLFLSTSVETVCYSEAVVVASAPIATSNHPLSNADDWPGTRRDFGFVTENAVGNEQINRGITGDAIEIVPHKGANLPLVVVLLANPNHTEDWFSVH